MTTQKLYLEGRFTELRQSDSNDIYKVGALVFLGEHQEARWLADQEESAHDINQRVFVQFHLGISYTRTSNYKKAAQLFKNNLQLIKTEDLSLDSQFLSYQGLGFYHYFFSRHKLSLKSTHQAHKILLKFDNKETKALYQILCLDLEGHNLVHRMRIHKGIKTLEKALEIADRNNMTAFKKSLTFSILIYRCKYLLSPTQGLNSLLQAYEKISPNDDYSMSTLIFEISNLYMLSGEFKKADQFLSQNYKVIYNTENKRLMGQLNFRMTYNLYRKGSFEQALYLAKSARSNLKKLTDRGLICQILGLEINILKAMGEQTDELEKELFETDKDIDNLLIKRRNHRSLKLSSPLNNGEDPRGDFFEKLGRDNDSSTYKELINN
ncbi:MAG: hypothetical protein HRT44_13215, partial [Bdellovibrionales bacterium]|nr:hypothetical protein [Bdellovibrionales bacterium]NQZ20197.1 hypothetical protein [Bdellovibrionales bacterium]